MFLYRLQGDVAAAEEACLGFVGRRGLPVHGEYDCFFTLCSTLHNDSEPPTLH